MAQPSGLRIRGARQNNLKNISLEIPHDRLTVVTGVSGCGKSSLAFDTLFAEGQWRYIESLSTYARMFLDRVDRPDVDRIEQIRPPVARAPKHPARPARPVGRGGAAGGWGAARRRGARGAHARLRRGLPLQRLPAGTRAAAAAPLLVQPPARRLPRVQGLRQYLEIRRGARRARSEQEPGGGRRRAVDASLRQVVSARTAEGR